MAGLAQLGITDNSGGGDPISSYMQSRGYTQGPDGRWMAAQVNPQSVPSGSGAGNVPYNPATDSRLYNEVSGPMDLNAQQADLQRQQSQLEAQLAAQAEQRRFDQLRSLLPGLSGNVSGVGGPGDSITYDNSGVAAAEDASNAASVAKAKDVAGQTGRAAITALQNNLAGRGLSTSKIGNPAIAQAVSTGASQIGDVNRQNLQNSLAANRARAAEQYSGQITQRGQDVTARGQTLNALNAPLNALLSSRY